MVTNLLSLSIITQDLKKGERGGREGGRGGGEGGVGGREGWGGGREGGVEGREGGQINSFPVPPEQLTCRASVP